MPDRCTIQIDRRYLSEENFDEVRSEVVDLLEDLRDQRPKFEYALRDLNRITPSMTDRNAPVVTTTAAAMQDVLGKAPDYVASPGSYDQKHIDRIGRLKNCIAYGPGVLDLAHKPDEWIGITDMLDSAKVMGRVLEKLLLT